MAFLRHTLLSLSAPCVPTFVVATTNCDTSITTVAWDSARGASSYTVHAVSTSGRNSTCTNTDTTCSFPDLDCGQNYTITVTTEDDNCVSLTSAPITVTTGTGHRYLQRDKLMELVIFILWMCLVRGHKQTVLL